MSSIIDEADDDSSSVIIISEHQVSNSSKQKVFKVSEIEFSHAKKDQQDST